MKNITAFFVCLTLLSSCKKDEQPPGNPFDDPALQAPAAQPNTYNPDPASFEYLYNNMFKPTCANSNCHDGSFEPDFRTIGSSYNTLVYAPVIITPTTNPYTYRVLPGNANASLIRHRLTQIPASGPGTLGQGRMPWIDTTYKFSASGSANIQKVIDWINNGAKDIFGNPAVAGNKNPNTLGFHVCNAGSNINKSRSTYLEISKNNGPVDMWFYVTDDVTAPQDLQSAEVKFSKKRYDFSAATTLNLSYVANGNLYPDITNSGNVQHAYKLSNFNLATLQPDTGFIFVRTYFKDPDHAAPAETPNNGSVYYTNYFVIRILP
jgi:hypothetical protein